MLICFLAACFYLYMLLILFLVGRSFMRLHALPRQDFRIANLMLRLQVGTFYLLTCPLCLLSVYWRAVVQLRCYLLACWKIFRKARVRSLDYSVSQSLPPR